MYNEDERKAKVKKQAGRGQEKLSAAHGALRQAPQAQQANVPTSSETGLDEYFDNLSAVSTTKKWVLEELIKSNGDLTTTNSELYASLAILVKANEKLSHRLGIRRNNLTCKDSPAPRPKNLFPHCKIEVMNAPNSSFGLNKSVTRCRLVWKGCF